MELIQLIETTINANKQKISAIGAGIHNAHMKKGDHARMIFSSMAAPELDKLREEIKQLEMELYKIKKDL